MLATFCYNGADRAVNALPPQVMLRVGDLQRSIDWYQNVMGMKLLRTRDNPEYKYTLAFMSYGPEESSTVIELTYNYGKTEYNKGDAYDKASAGAAYCFLPLAPCTAVVVDTIRIGQACMLSDCTKAL